MEIFDITDDNGFSTGETVSRSDANDNGIPHRTAHIWIVRKEVDKYQVLLQKRSAEKESFPGIYDTSSAGHIQAGDAEIIYGHMENNDFVLDHFDSISLFEELETGGYKIKAESDNGVQYTYQPSEENADILEYYETWNEDEFSEKYSGGASLSRCD